MWWSVLLVVLSQNFNAADALQWSKSYTLKAVLTVPAANISEPYQVWLDGETGKSRVDFYDGMDKLYRDYDGVLEKYRYFKIHPESSAKFSNRNVCREVSADAPETKMYAVNSYLPIKNFKFISFENINNIKTHKFSYEYQVKLQSKVEAKLVYTVWVTFERIEDTSFTIPVRYVYALKIGEKNLDYFRHDYLHFDFSKPKASVFYKPEDIKCYELTDSFDHEPIDPLTEFVEPFIEHSRVSKAFDRFKMKHNKLYTNEREHFKRMSIFKDNLRSINSLNRLHRSFTVGVNQFADLSLKEIKVFLGTKITPEAIERYENSDEDDDENLINGSNVDSALDWRDYYAVSLVKDQTPLCGSCYAFTTAAAVESSAYIARGCENMVEVSEQAIVDCSWGNSVRVEEGNLGCTGGTYEYTLQWAKDHGLPVKDEYGPYLAMEGRCHLQNMTKLVKISGFNELQRNKRIIKKALQKTGPLLAAVDSMPFSFTFYNGGIYDDPECSSKPNDRSHGVNIIGYGRKEEGADYWILKNSYGSSWGENGFMRITTKNNVCGVKNFVYNIEFLKPKTRRCFKKYNKNATLDAKIKQ